MGLELEGSGIFVPSPNRTGRYQDKEAKADACTAARAKDYKLGYDCVTRSKFHDQRYSLRVIFVNFLRGIAAEQGKAFAYLKEDAQFLSWERGRKR